MLMRHEVEAHRAWLATLRDGDTVMFPSLARFHTAPAAPTKIVRMTPTQFVVATIRGHLEYRVRRADGAVVGNPHYEICEATPARLQKHAEYTSRLALRARLSAFNVATADFQTVAALLAILDPPRETQPEHNKG